MAETSRPQERPVRPAREILAAGKARDKAAEVVGAQGRLYKPPLKVFLSDSHLDEPKLIPEFRNHLQALEDDGLITVWSDRDIASSLDWDREINGRPNECDLFIALTSAAFNSTGYIRGIEMQTAWERHAAGQCRIVPIMLRQWRPPQRFRALQFLPSIDRAVADARKKDDVLYQIVVKIEEVVKEMTEGRWAPRSPVE